MSAPASPGLGEILQHIGHDVRTIASDELEMGRAALVDRLESIVKKLGVGLLGATVALIGFAMLCMTMVFALHPVIPQLWLRMLIMSIVYLGSGGAAALYIAKKLGTGAGGDDLGHQIDEARDTMDAVGEGLSH
jgi:Putative Actinobacterial Holin-X, holin superfamily III